MYVQPDAERTTVDVLAPAMRGEATVAVGIPRDWAGESHIQVDSDGTPEIQYPARFGSSIRITAWASNRTEAKRLAAKASAILHAYEGPVDARFRITAGVLVTPDDETGAVLAFCNLRLDQRGIPA